MDDNRRTATNSRISRLSRVAGIEHISIKNKKIVITGSSGLLGSNACIMLKEIYTVTGTYFSFKPELGIINQINLDIRNKNLCEKEIAKINPDVILHCAAITNMDYCETNIKDAHDVNTLGTKNILESIDNDCHFIFISTDNVYNNGKQFNRENSKKNITNVYGYTKREAEKSIIKSSLKYTILRTNIFGWHFAGRKSGLLHFIYDNLKQNKMINLFHDVYFTPISVNNLINGLIKIINNEVTGTYNYGGQERLSKFDFGVIVADVFKLDYNLINSISIDEMHFKAKRPKEMSMNSKKISKYFSIYHDVYSQIKDLSKFPV